MDVLLLGAAAVSAIKVVPRPDGSKPRTSELRRRCRACGTKVNSYKNPSAKTTLCYCCEDKLPWTYALIAGGGTFAENPEDRRSATKVVDANSGDS